MLKDMRSAQKILKYSHKSENLFIEKKNYENLHFKYNFL